MLSSQSNIGSLNLTYTDPYDVYVVKTSDVHFYEFKFMSIRVITKLPNSEQSYKGSFKI
jgi:hypothetical protein